MSLYEKFKKNIKKKGIINTALGVAITVLIMFFVFMFIRSYCRNENSIGLKGVGNRVNPYRISSESDLKKFAAIIRSGNTFKNCNIIQTCDIEISDDADYFPLAAGRNAFCGNYNGGGYALKNVNIEGKNVALFENMEGTLRNITIKSGNIEGEIVAPFAIKSNEKAAHIYNCYNYASLTGRKRTNGIADSFINGSIVFCQDYGKHSTDNYYSLCSTSVKELIVAGDFELTLPSSFNGYIYKITTSLENQKRIINSYMALKTYKSNPDVSVDISNGKIVLTKKTLTSKLIEGIKGKGTELNPYVIDSVDDFVLFKDLVNCGIDFYKKYWVQNCEVNLENYDNFEPIGIFDSGNYFWGHYDGNGYPISGLKMIREDNCGLFGALAGEITNVYLKDSYIEGGCVGGIASHSVSGSYPQIINCLVDIKLKGNARAGYIADNFDGGDIALCVANVGEDTRNIPICSYAVRNLMKSYVSRNDLVDCSEINNQPLTIGKISNTEVKGKLSDYLNDYISKHTRIRNFNHTKFCLWDDKEGIVLTSNKQRIISFALVNYIIVLSLIVLLFKMNSNLNIIHKMNEILKGGLQRGDYNKNLYLLIIYSLMVIFFIGNFLTKGLGVDRLFFWALRDTFSDRLAMIESADMYCSERYSLVPSFYPPLNNILYWIPSSILGDSLKNRFSYLGTDMENDSFVIMLWVFYMIIIIVSLFVVVCKYIGDCSTRKILFGFSIFLLGPVLYAIERGNSVLLAVLFSILFFCYYDSDRVMLRESALISLAVAASIKIYPLIFFVVCLKTGNSTGGKVRTTIKFMLYGALINIAAFIPYGGMTAIIDFVNNLFANRGGGHSSALLWTEGGIDYYNLLRFFVNTASASSLRKILMLITLLCTVYVFINAKKIYEKSLILVIVICTFPLESYYYVLSFLIIPLIQLYKEENLSMADYIVGVELISILGLCPYYFIDSVYRLNGTISTIMMIVIMLTLVGRHIVVNHKMNAGKYLSKNGVN